MKKVMVIGGGAWGTALAQAAAAADNDVTLVVRGAEQAVEINNLHTNQRFLGAQALHLNIEAATGFEGVADADVILLSVPAQASRETLQAIGAEALTGKPVVLCAKGFETRTMALQSQILGAQAPGAKPLVLSGPSFAVDVAAGRPTAVTLAAKEIGLAEEIAQILASAQFRPYASGDLMGVELAGGLKNVYALGCGAVDGAGLGLSARSALMARGYAEMARLVENMGGQAQTLTGLAGLGDLALSCTSEQSRNYTFGVELGRGRKVDDIMAAGAKLAEGVMTAPAALALAKTHDVDMPLVGAVNMLLDGQTKIGEIVAGLMTRPLKREGGH